MWVSIKSWLPKKVKAFIKNALETMKPLGSLDRKMLSYHYLSGNGIEIGALHNPLKVKAKAKVKYVDRYDNKRLCQDYPEQLSQSLVYVDIIDDGETLATLPNESQDFVIANHFIEHCQNPLSTLSHMYRVLKNHGILYLAIPDKRYTFDVNRPITSLDHLLKDYEEGPEASKREHFAEWVKLVNVIQHETQAEEMTEKLIRQDYSIHFHVWTQAEILEIFLALKSRVGLKLEIEACLKNGVEFITILRKTEV